MIKVKLFLSIFFITLSLLGFCKSFAQSSPDSKKIDETIPQSSGVAFLDDKSDNVKFSSTAIVQILNKTTAKSSLVELKINQKINLGTITLKARKCWQAPLEQKPETKILLEVFENKVTDSINQVVENTRIFYGWLFASSPSISGMEHPIYDITAISCKK
ncbi:hypothetical protein LBMAG18_10720 [Alphaproteobacteria bacterium]|nr:hypothetical protein LBMAG18_10720 [Alphaproteobacteria bacterium]